MNLNEIEMHLRAATDAGKDSACGLKIQHSTLESAQSHANSLNKRREVQTGEKHRVEPYPCPWCSPDVWEGEVNSYDNDPFLYWHVGREMTLEEKEKYGGK